MRPHRWRYMTNGDRLGAVAAVLVVVAGAAAWWTYPSPLAYVFLLLAALLVIVARVALDMRMRRTRRRHPTGPRRGR